VFPFPTRNRSGPAIQSARLIGGELARARGAVLLVIVLGVLSAIAETAGVGMVLLLLSVMFRSTTTRDAAGDQSDGMLDDAVQRLVGWFDGNVGLAIAVLVLLILLRLAVVALQELVASRVTVQVADRTRTRLFAACMAIPLLDLRSRSWGELYTIVEQHSASVPDVFGAVCSMVREMIVLLTLGALLLVIAPVLAASAVASLLVISGLLHLVERPVARAGQDIADTNREMADILIRTFQGIRTFRAFGLTATQISRFAALSRRSAAVEHRYEVLASLTEPASHISALLAVMIMALVATATGSGSATLVLAVGLLYRLQPYVAALDANRLFLAERLPSLQIVFEALRAGQPERSGTLPVPTPPATIRFDDVTFRYPGAGQVALQRVSLAIAPVGWTHVDGPSGAGKSTLVNLLLRLFDPTSGSITVAGARLADIDIEAWRGTIAVCGQEIELVHGSVRDNILLGASQACDAAVERAVRAAGLHALVAGLPHGLDTMLGEQGNTLSGGQRQRVGIARALVRAPRLLVLDEATSALDRPSQRAVFDAIEQDMRGRAVLVIGHQLDHLPPIAAHHWIGPSR
jgi:subfamily B ATP-binding cassette protein MsbA